MKYNYLLLAALATATLAACNKDDDLEDLVEKTEQLETDGEGDEGDEGDEGEGDGGEGDGGDGEGDDPEDEQDGPPSIDLLTGTTWLYAGEVEDGEIELDDCEADDTLDFEGDGSFLRAYNRGCDDEGDGAADIGTYVYGPAAGTIHLTYDVEGATVDVAYPVLRLDSFELHLGITDDDDGDDDDIEGYLRYTRS